MGGERVHYRETQTLKRDDLGDEQAHRIHARRRHNIAQHAWGIVRGLQLRIEQAGVFLTPGFAVDGYGRELIVDKRIDFSADLFQQLIEHEKGSEDEKQLSYYAVDIWLNYRVRIHEPDTQSIAQETFKGTGRVCEEAWIKMHCADPKLMVDPDRPPGVPSADLEFKPYQGLAIDSKSEWPVYLGRVVISFANGEFAFYLPVAKKTYASAVGAGVNAPWNGGWMQIGASIFSDKNRFSVLLPDVEGEPVRRFSLDKDSNAVFNGDVSLRRYSKDLTKPQGQLSLVPGAPYAYTGPALGFTALDANPEEASPWKMYRADLDKDNGDKKQLRFEIFNPGDEGDPALSQWVIGGEFQPQGQGAFPFFPMLKVQADGAVVVSGTMEVKGRRFDGPIPLDFNDPRFRNELLSRWTRGLTTAGREVDAFYAVALAMDVYFFDSLPDPIPDPLPTAVEPGDLVGGNTYDILININNVSRELTARLLRILFSVEFYAAARKGMRTSTLFELPDEPDIVSGQVKQVVYRGYMFNDTDDDGLPYPKPESAKVAVTITTSGLANNTSESLHGINIVLN